MKPIRSSLFKKFLALACLLVALVVTSKNKLTASAEEAHQDGTIGQHRNDNSEPSSEQSQSLKEPSSSSEEFPLPYSLRYGRSCSLSKPCWACEGNCFNNDALCKDKLVCLKRPGKQLVPGCRLGGPGDVPGGSYCHWPITYVPGDTRWIENGLLLSAGLTAKKIAIRGKRVPLADRTLSNENFHEDPDGAAVFHDAKTGGWIYVSNAESSKRGGVGAIAFNSKGQVTNYTMILKNRTRRNCGGGKTFWNTWLTCEEDTGGQVWEVDPWGDRPARKTIIGGKQGDWFESAAYDNRNKYNPTFYVTTDAPFGALLKFTPDRHAIARALNTRDYSSLLHYNATGSAKVQYLMLNPTPPKHEAGYFHWIDNLQVARKNARAYSQNCEGIDIRNGKLYMTCKAKKHLFILDLDKREYTRSSTQSGAFDHGPDQVARILGGNRNHDVLYFCEDGGDKNIGGVHGRDATGKFYTILECTGKDFKGETTGLAFSPDRKHMYVSFQDPGIIFDVRRRDGYPFDGQKLDIKYHAMSPDSSFD